MSKPYRAKMGRAAGILLIIFVCSTIVSALSIYYTHQLPTYENRTETLCLYQHIGAYDYVAELKPNVIYNRTMLTSRDDATLYTAIVKSINLTFTYSFRSSPEPQSIRIEHQTTIQIESPARWLRTLSENEAHELFQISGGLNWTMQINPTKVRQFAEAIDREVYGAARSTTCNINIKPKIHVAANVTVGNAVKNIDETFTPELTVAFKTDVERGNYISMGNLKQTKTGAITETRQIPLPWVQSQRAASIMAAAASAIALAASTLLHVKYKPAPPPAKRMEKITDPYKDLIAETTRKPPETEATIELKTLEDLAKIAEILARPILHTAEDDEHTFYIIDNNTKYIYKIKA